MPREKGLYIVFEGGEASGKTTQSRILAEKLGSRAIHTFEPGRTETGAKLREILLSPETEHLGSMTEAYLMAADRAHHIDRVVRPTLEERKHVISDRSFISSVAYQGAARGLGVERILDLNLMNPGLILPDLVIIMAPPSRELLSQRLKDKPDKLEAAGDDFHKKVAECFGQMASILEADSRTEGICVATLNPESCGQPKTIEDVQREVILEIEDFCSDKGLISPV